MPPEIRANTHTFPLLLSLLAVFFVLFTWIADSISFFRCELIFFLIFKIHFFQIFSVSFFWWQRIKLRCVQWKYDQNYLCLIPTGVDDEFLVKICCFNQLLLKKKFSFLLVKNVITFVLLRPEARLTCECFVREPSQLLKSQFGRWRRHVVRRSPTFHLRRCVRSGPYVHHSVLSACWRCALSGLRRSEMRCAVLSIEYEYFSQYIQPWKYIQSHVDGWSKRIKKPSLSLHT